MMASNCILGQEVQITEPGFKDCQIVSLCISWKKNFKKSIFSSSNLMMPDEFGRYFWVPIKKSSRLGDKSAIITTERTSYSEFCNNPFSISFQLVQS
jgi:hypothetical protein